MSEALLVLGIGLNALFWIAILVALARNRESVDFRLVAKWAIFLALVPGLGLLGLLLESTGSYGTFFLVVLAAIVVLGFVLLARDRHTMRTREVVKWVAIMVLLPALGALGYISWRAENAVKRGTPDRRDSSAPFLRSPTFKDRR